MPATPFGLQTCHRTKQDGTRQDGWQVVRIDSGQPDPEPLHEPWYGVYSKQMATAFLDGVLLMFFSSQLSERKKPSRKKPSRKREKNPRSQQLQFT